MGVGCAPSTWRSHPVTIITWQADLVHVTSQSQASTFAALKFHTSKDSRLRQLPLDVFPHGFFLPSPASFNRCTYGLVGIASPRGSTLGHSIDASSPSTLLTMLFSQHTVLAPAMPPTALSQPPSRHQSDCVYPRPGSGAPILSGTMQNLWLGGAYCGLPPPVGPSSREVNYFRSVSHLCWSGMLPDHLSVLVGSPLCVTGFFTVATCSC